jgi:hypothetical protein
MNAVKPVYKAQPWVLDFEKSVELAKSAQTEQVHEAVIEGVAVTFKDIINDLSTDKDPKLALLDMEDRLKRIREERRKSWATDWIFNLIEASMLFFRDFFLLSNYAQITGERTRLQPLRKIERPLLLDLSTAMEYLRRNRDYYDNFRDVLARTGYTDTDIERLRSLIDYVPGVQDVIRFAVREVYMPDVVKKFDLSAGFRGLSQQAFIDAERAGVKKEDLEKYWQAHWILPSPNQAYEMLHRGQIDMDTLKMILRTNDYMPKFIDAFVNIAYAPLTRVDIRRIHKTLSKTRDWVRDRYKEIGYNDDNASTLADFTVELNREKKKKDKTIERDLTKTDILALYRIQILERSDVKLALNDLGYDDDEAELYIAREDMRQELDRIDLLVKAYKKAYLAGIMERSEVESKLYKLNLPTRYVSTLFDTWEIDREIKSVQPTKAELLGWLRKGLISTSRAEHELSSMGYDSFYVALYVKGAVGK